MTLNEDPKVSDPKRRSLLKAAVIGVNAMLASAMGIPVFGYVLGPLFRARERQWVEAGKIEEFGQGVPQSKRLKFASRDGFRELEKSRNVWVTLQNGDLTVFSSVCTHLGCNVLWKTAEGRFVCPCHGGQFSPEGKVLAGPPPRPLDRLPSKVENGKVWVQV